MYEGVDFEWIRFIRHRGFEDTIYLMTDSNIRPQLSENIEPGFPLFLTF